MGAARVERRGGGAAQRGTAPREARGYLILTLTLTLTSYADDRLPRRSPMRSAGRGVP